MSRIKEISAADLYHLLQKGQPLELVDIRTPAEIQRGVLPNAKTLPMHLVPLKLGYFSEFPGPIVVYCRTGSRSAQVCRFLNQQGIDNVISLRGGIVRWSAGRMPLEAEPAGALA